MDEFRAILDVIVHIVVILGVPAALYRYFHTTRKEQLDRQYTIYGMVDDKLIEFQMLCLQYPNLDIFDVQDSLPKILTEEQKKQEIIGFTVLITIFERAYLMYSDQTSEIKQRQWTGWDSYIGEFCERENFKKAWRINGGSYDSGFEQYLKKKMIGKPPANQLPNDG